ncbi:RDD family protein [Pontibacter silvestris]|uniref:RDD family protein n=1 Tax=Pontibacter silvestris TaxID=2305183 RepID=A0ABW4WSR8_9BACT|nr:RDD family protein [Pontibacter silvestris]MCC9138584.1 RDD family protein [Pontibacter silvestris]
MQTTYTQSNKNIALADLSTRVLAFMLDMFILLTLIGIADYLTFSSDDEALLIKPERWLHFLLSWLYFAGTEVCPCQATLGKYLLGLKVTGTSGFRLSLRQASVRFFAKPFTLFVILIRFLNGLPYFTRSLFHDRLANSQVVAK